MFSRIDERVQLRLHPGQRRAWDSKARFVFLIAGTQSGKTSFEPWWLYREICNCGPGDYIAATATYDLFKLKLLPDMKSVFCDQFGWEYHASDRIITDGKSRIILRSANVPGGLESATAKAAVLDECGQDSFRLESWEAVLRRLALSGGRILGGTTPYNTGWLKTEVYDQWTGGNKDFYISQFNSLENPSFPVDEYYRAKTILADWKFRMFYNGDFTRPAGLIYGDYDESIHLVNPFTIPPQWPHYVGVDFGGVNTAAIWIVENPETRCYFAYREYLDGGKASSEHSAELERLGAGENIVKYTGGSGSEDQQRMDFRVGRVNIQEPPILDVKSGIDKIIELLRTKRLFIFNTLRGVRSELGTYSRKVDQSGQVTETINDKEKFHRLDALRYCVLGMKSRTIVTVGGKRIE